MATELDVRVTARFLAAGAVGTDLPPTGKLEIAFAGRSNVGKSSLLNSLMQRRGLVRTSKTPGATRTVNLFEAVLLSGPSFVFADLPGYGFADRSKAERASWGKMLETYFKTRAELAGLVLLIDVRRGLEPDDQALIDFAASLDRPLASIVCATKLDKVPLSKRKPLMLALRRKLNRPVIGYSAINHEGREALWRELIAIANARASGAGAVVG